MLLSPRHVFNREFRRGMGERRSELLLIHDSLLSSCAGLSGMTHAAQRAGLRVKHHEIPRPSGPCARNAHQTEIYDAAYFQRNLRTIDVLIDQDAVRAGAAVGQPWRFYDLGHGYCTYDFFDQCPHRMACAKCSFYLPKGSTMAALVEGKNNLLRMRQEIPLSDAELAALDDGVSALESLLSRLADVPTPAGPTPLQLRDTALIQIEAAD